MTGRILLTAIAAAGALYAQKVPAEASESLTSERAEYTVTAEVVGPGVFQFESGILAELAYGMRVIHAPAPLFRLGLTRNLEVRAGGDGAVWHPGDADCHAGLTDMVLEVKWKLRAEGHYLPGLALLPSVSLPAGRSGYTSAAYDPMVKLALSKSLPAGFRVSSNLNIASLTDDGVRHQSRAASLCFEHDLARGLVMYWESYRIWQFEAAASPQTAWNSGIFRAVGRNAQVDLEVARVFQSATPHWCLGAGLVLRGPRPLWRR